MWLDRSIYDICGCYCTVRSAIWEIFSEFFIFRNLFHEENICQYCNIPICENYVKCMMISNGTYFFVLTNLKHCLIQFNTNLCEQAKAKTANVNLTYLYFQTFWSLVFPYFNSNILYPIHLLCTWWFFIMDLFLMDNSFECLIFPNSRLHLKTRTRLLVWQCRHLYHQSYIVWNFDSHEFRG